MSQTTLKDNYKKIFRLDFSTFTICIMLGILSSPDLFQHQFFLKNYFRNTIKSLDRDQARHFAGPDLGPNCLPRLSADNASMQRVI